MRDFFRHSICFSVRRHTSVYLVVEYFPVRTDPEIFGLSAGNYIVTVTDSKGCTGTASVEIRETPALSVEAEIIKASCPDTPDGSVILTVTGGMQPYNVIWSDNVTTQNRNSILPGTYVVVVSDYNGCSGSLTVEVDFMGTYNCLVIPDIITPNNDGHNDEWIITNIDLYPDAEVRIFNRWGKMIFRTKNISANPWDGRSDGDWFQLTIPVYTLPERWISSQVRGYHCY